MDPLHSGFRNFFQLSNFTDEISQTVSKAVEYKLSPRMLYYRFESIGHTGDNDNDRIVPSCDIVHYLTIQLSTGTVFHQEGINFFVSGTLY